MAKKPSELIRMHARGTGGGFELDDLMSRWTGGVYDEISGRIQDIHQRFRTAEHPIGASNPASFEELEELASELEQRGY